MSSTILFFSVRKALLLCKLTFRTLPFTLAPTCDRLQDVSRTRPQYSIWGTEKVARCDLNSHSGK